jgi:hypothetical protein
MSRYGTKDIDKPMARAASQNTSTSASALSIFPIHFNIIPNLTCVPRVTHVASYITFATRNTACTSDVPRAHYTSIRSPWRYSSTAFASPAQQHQREGEKRLISRPGPAAACILGTTSPCEGRSPRAQVCTGPEPHCSGLWGDTAVS